MLAEQGKYIFGVVKVGERGQIVIPKEAREIMALRRATVCWCLAIQKVWLS
jgi:hypothetical protein